MITLNHPTEKTKIGNYLVMYDCPRNRTAGGLPVIRAVSETDPINAILAARREERELTGVNCPDCVLTRVHLT